MPLSDPGLSQRHMVADERAMLLLDVCAVPLL
jgi:hypothetical protein